MSSTRGGGRIPRRRFLQGLAAGGAAVGAGSGAAVGAGTGYGAGRGALVGTGIGAAAGALYDITRFR